MWSKGKTNLPENEWKQEPETLNRHKTYEKYFLFINNISYFSLLKLAPNVNLLFIQIHQCCKDYICKGGNNNSTLSGALTKCFIVLSLFHNNFI